MHTITCKNIKVTYILKKNQLIDGLDGLSITFSSGKVNILFGENGCGKTTLFNCITGILPYDGEIYFDETDSNLLTIKDRHISYVRQNLYLFPKLTIFDNLAFPLKNAKLDSEEICKRIYGVLELLEIPYLMNCVPSQISIGQLQKVCLAKALITNPQVLILDEAFSNIDEPCTKTIQKVISDYAHDNDAIVIYVTHNIDDALSFGDYFYIIDKSSIIFEGEKKDVGKVKLNALLVGHDIQEK